MSKFFSRILFVIGLLFCIKYEFALIDFIFDNNKDTSTSSSNQYEEEADRVQVSNTYMNPYNSVCYIVAYFPDGMCAQGSGTLIASNQVLTAAHVVYSIEDGGFATDIEVTPAHNGPSSDPYGSSYSLNITVPSGWTKSEDFDCDFAIIEIADNFSNYLPYRDFEDYDYPDNLVVTNIGYPSDMNGYMYCDTEPILDSDDNIIKINNEIYYGDSGGPVLDEENYIVGIVSHTQTTLAGNKVNVAVCINDEISDFINDYMVNHANIY